MWYQDRMFGRTALLILLPAFLTPGCSGKEDRAASRSECLKVRQHTATLRMASVKKNSKLSKDELARHETAYAKTSDVYLDKCVEERSKAWVTCMLELESLQAAGECD